MKKFGIGSVLHGELCVGFVSIKFGKQKNYYVKFASGEKLSLQEVEEMLLDNNG